MQYVPRHRQAEEAKAKEGLTLLYYVAHRYGGNTENITRAAKITNALQKKDLQNAYICPLLAFSHLGYKEIGWDEEMALCLDLLSVCDVLIVASEPSKGVQKEIDFARMVGMEVVDLAEKYRSI